MTNKEAIKELRDASDSEVRYGDTEYHYDKVMKRVEAFDMAIKALEQQPCEDCISRAEALHACCDEWNKDYKEIMKSIRQLPSVTPQPYKAESEDKE